MRSPELAVDGNKIRTARELAALTQASLAERLGVGRTAVAHWEAGRYQPEGENFRNLCRVLKVTQRSLLATTEAA